MRTEQRVEELLAKMTLQEKIGQMCQASGSTPEHQEMARRGEIGSLLNVAGSQTELFQRIAREESRLGIPLLFGLDVIHGLKTILPIPLGQAASFNPDIVFQGAHVAAREAAAYGINWTFAPMVDIARDPRWGRIAEGGGEDPFLAGRMGAAMVSGFQGNLGDGAAQAEPPADIRGIAACAKHYVGYGAAEGGRDYNTTLIPERTLRNVYLVPFKACVDAGVATLMSAFNDLNDVPASGNAFTIRTVLKKEWHFDGFVVSDWASTVEMINHGFCADRREVAATSAKAGVDMEMVETSYRDHLAQLVSDGTVPIAVIDDAVRRILIIKFRLGLFDCSVKPRLPESVFLSKSHLAVARGAALESCVLLKNDGVLPLAGARTVAVIGPLADAPLDQLGCWSFSDTREATITPLGALRTALGADYVMYETGVTNCRDSASPRIAEAAAAAQKADVAILCVGEDAGLSGEAHSRAFLNLPGAQEELVRAVAATGKPVIAVVMAGRPLTLGGILPHVKALLFAWHPGTMGGTAIADILLGKEAPSGRLPVCFPRTVGQIPLYYARKNTGRPPKDWQYLSPRGNPLDPSEFSSLYMDVDYRPEFPFGFGLGYTTFAFSPVTLDRSSINKRQRCRAIATVTNTGTRRGAAVAQLYIRDIVASATRPVKELKGFEKLWLEPGESRRVTFPLSLSDLAFCNGKMKWGAEPGKFLVWIASDSTCSENTPAELELTDWEIA